MNKLESKLIHDIARKLSDFEYLQEIVYNSDNYIQFEGKVLNPFDQLYLSNGLPSLCVLFGELSEHYPDEDWDLIGHEYIKKIGEELSERGSNSLSLFYGLAGIGLGALCLSKEGERYQGFIQGINALINNQLGDLVDHLRQKKQLNMEDYDAISGISGIFNYCILSPDIFEENIKKILEYIIHISQEKKVGGLTVPGWYLPVSSFVTERDKELWPEGYVNLGVSHGISALLMVLCNAKRVGITIDGQDETIKRIADFLLQYKIVENEHIYWGTHVSLTELLKGEVTNTNTRDAWCYGTPGTAYALLLAGKVTDNKVYVDQAIRGMTFAVNRLLDIYSPTFCHGLSGVAYISYRFFEETNMSFFNDKALDLVEEIESQYDENHPVGFKNIESKGDEGSYDHVGLIDGTAGILLTLLAIKSGKKTPWDTAFGLNQVKIDKG